MPRPSSPVHAKASTKCPYLTLENPHHQRQHRLHNPGVAIRRCGGNLSLCCERHQLFAKNSRAATASILRTHSQCQRWPASGRPRVAARIGFLHLEHGGASRDRTGDLKLAKLALSQLSYGPSFARLAASFGGQARAKIWSSSLETFGGRTPLPRQRQLVEPAGIEPATSSLQS